MAMQYEAEILSVNQETDDIYTFKIERHENFNFNPGQYVWISLEGYSKSPMAIASGQHDDHLMLTIRRWGDLTTALFKLSVGDTVNIDGPYGTYFPVDSLNAEQNLYLIAGGTGITPVRSLLRTLSNGTIPHLFYGAQEKKQLLYLEEFENSEVNSHFTIDQPEDGWTNNVGFVTDLLSKTVLDKTGKFFICGPKPMLIATKDFLNSLNLDPSNIFVSVEKFDQAGNVVGPVLQITDPNTGL